MMRRLSPKSCQSQVYLVGHELLVRTDEAQRFYQSLSDQQAVEPVVVVWGQIGDRQGVVVLDREFGDPVSNEAA